MARVCRLWRSVARFPRLLAGLNLGGKFAHRMNLAMLERILAPKFPYDFSKTTTVDLSDCSFIGDLHLLRLAEKAPNLTAIDLSGCTKVTIQGLQALLKACPGLKDFDFSDAERLSKNLAVQTVASTQKEKLERVVVRGAQVTDAALRAVMASCPSLRVLDFSLTSIRRLPVGELQQKCPNLRELVLACCDVECVRTRSNGNQPGPGFPHLEIFSVARGSVLRAGSLFLQILPSTPNLRVLDIRGTQFPLQAPPPI